MRYRNKFAHHMLLIMILLLPLTSYVACSGGGSDGLLAGGGIGGSGISIGTVSGFGSIIVNSVEFDTGTAEVLIGGDQVGVGDPDVRDFLSRGMVVRVEGNIRQDGIGTADRIEFNENVQGPVENIAPIDEFTTKIVVMGQTVILENQTRFIDTSINAIAIDNVLEVSGLPDSDGFIRATYAAKKADSLLPGTEVGLRGVVSGVDTSQETFRINMLSVDYSLADVGNLPGGAPANGHLVEVKGTLDGNSVLVAARIAIEDQLGVDNAENAEIEGIVSLLLSPSNFNIGSVEILTDAATSFEGLDPEDIDLGSKLVVKGALTNRILLADRVIAKDVVKLQSNVADVDTTDKTLTLDGLESITVRINELTKFLGKADDLNQIQFGDNARIFGRVLPNDTVLASKVMIKSASSDKVMLKGPVTDRSPTDVTILGISVDTIMIPDDGFELSDGTTITREEFLSTAGIGNIVNAKGTLSGLTVTWTGLELENED